jgi:hypothetical protein
MIIRINTLLGIMLFSANTLFGQCLDKKKYVDLTAEEEFLPLLATMPLQMEAGGAKLFNKGDGSIWLVSIGVTEARQAISGELLRRQMVAKSKAQANAVATLNGESVKAVTILEDKMVTRIENGVEKAVAEETLNESIVIEARGVLKGMPVVASWLSIDGKLFYVAIGQKIKK